MEQKEGMIEGWRDSCNINSNIIQMGHHYGLSLDALELTSHNTNQHTDKEFFFLLME